MRVVGAKVWLTVVLFSSIAIAAGQKTVWDGVYTTAQADRGKSSYKLFCQSCHQEDLSGGADGSGQAPALKGGRIMSRKDVDNLFTYIRVWMPNDDRGSLDDQTCIDIVAYILQQNAFPDGAAELRADHEALKQILLVSRPQ